MGRKGVSKRKKPIPKVKPLATNNSGLKGLIADNQPEQVTAKSKTRGKDKNKR
jgi:hypothetical protein